jgi:DNA invertase Pin-like site-specific DNA recombinase
MVDTTTASGKLIFHVFAALAEFERDLIRERTVAGIAAARARGRCGGRKPKLDGAAIEMAWELLKTHPLSDVAGVLKVSESTVRRRVMNTHAAEALSPANASNCYPKLGATD